MSKRITEEILDGITEECYAKAKCPREYIKILAQKLNEFFTCDCGGACKGEKAKTENNPVVIERTTKKLKKPILNDTLTSPTGFLSPDSCKS